MKTAKLILNIILGCGLMCVFSEGDSLVPNFIGLVCFVLLIAVNAPDNMINKIQNK